jgi:hypothetical protein
MDEWVKGIRDLMVFGSSARKEAVLAQIEVKTL